MSSILQVGPMGTRVYAPSMDLISHYHCKRHMVKYTLRPTEQQQYPAQIGYNKDERLEQMVIGWAGHIFSSTKVISSFCVH